MVALSALLFTGFCAPADAATGSREGDPTHFPERHH